MKNFNRKQKIIIICIGIMFIGAVAYYVYANQDVNRNGEIFLDDKVDTQGNVLNNALEEKTEAEKIKDVTVYITGAINKPGVYVLPEGSRISDVVDKAEGLTEDADDGTVNLAYVIEDGMHIIFPRKNEIRNSESYMTTESGLDVNNTIGKSTSGENKKIGSAKININVATKEELETLTGIGASTADKIINYRKEKGNFKNIEDIKNVNGIGKSKYNKIKDEICVK